MASYDGADVARALAADHDPPPVDAGRRRGGAGRRGGVPGLTSHPFPTCFACGTDREPGDGLRIFPGPVAGRAGRRDLDAAPERGRRLARVPRRRPARSATPSPGRRWTAPAAGPPTSASG